MTRPRNNKRSAPILTSGRIQKKPAPQARLNLTRFLIRWLKTDRTPWFWIILATSITITAGITERHTPNTTHQTNNTTNRNNTITPNTPLPCRVLRIIDGDTVTLDCGPNHNNVRVRLACIDAPETHQPPWGEQSTNHLKQLTGNHVTLISEGTDRWNRTIGRLIDHSGDDINRRMVTDGWAAVYPRYCNDQSFYRAQQTARHHNRGIWMIEGLHQRPWEAR